MQKGHCEKQNSDVNLVKFDLLKDSNLYFNVENINIL